MMAFQVNAALPTAKSLIPEGGSSFSQRGPDAAGYPSYRSFGMRAAAAGGGGGGGGQVAFGQNNHMRRKFPIIPPLSKSRDWSALVSGFLVGGPPSRAKDDLGKDIIGKHFLFDDKCSNYTGSRLERTRTVIPPLPRDFHVHRPGNLRPISLSKELSHSHAGRPFTLGYPERHELTTSPAILLPSTLVLNGRNTFAVENCKLSRPKVNYPTYNILTVKDNQKGQTYPDPMVGAPRSFIHRISELSSLEGETVRQEKLKKLRKPRKPS